MVEFVEKFDSSSTFILDRDAASPTFVVNMSKVKKEFLDEFVESLNEIKRLERKKYEKFQRKKSIRLSKKKMAPKVPAIDHQIKSFTKSNIITDANGYVFITEDTVFDGNCMINTHHSMIKSHSILNQQEKDFLNDNDSNKTSLKKSPVPDESYFSDSSYSSAESGAFIKKAAQIVKQEQQSSGHSSDNEHDSLSGNPVNFAYEQYPNKLNNKYSRFNNDYDDDALKTEGSGENSPVKIMSSAESVAYTKAPENVDNFAYDQYPNKLNNKYSRFTDDDDEKTPIKKVTKYQRKCKTEIKKNKKFDKKEIQVEGETLENNKNNNKLTTLDKSKKIFESLVNLAKRTTGYRKSMRSYHLKDYKKYDCIEKDVANLTL